MTTHRALVAVAAFVILVTVILIAPTGKDSPVHVFDDRELAATGPCDRRTPAVKGTEAVDLVAYPVHSLGFSVAFLAGRSRVLAVTFTGPRRIEVYVRRCHSVTHVARVLAHEVGHAVDHRLMTPERRGEYLAVRGISGEWFGCNRCTDYATPAGDYAEVFAWTHGPRFRWGRGRMAPAPTPEQAAALAPFFEVVPVPPTVAPSTTTTSSTTRPSCAVAIGSTCVVP
jgi:hypothetical protein